MLEIKNIIANIAKEIDIDEIDIDDKIAKLSLVGIGMRSHSGIASKMFYSLGQEGVNIQLISTSEIKVSVVVDEKYLELGVRTLHEAFDLGKNIGNTSQSNDKIAAKDRIINKVVSIDKNVRNI